MEYDLYFKQRKQMWVLYIDGKLMYEDENLLKVLAELDRILKDSELKQIAKEGDWKWEL